MTPSSPAVQFITVDENHADQRLDNFLRARLGYGLPKSYIYRIIRKGEVRVNKGRAKPDTRLKAGDVVRIPPVRLPSPSDPVEVKPSQIQLFNERVLFENDELLVLNKPAGMPVHGGTGLSFGVIDIARAARPEAKFLELVHRLDKGTSGCLLLAKKRAALLDLQSQLQSEAMTKTYLALTRGRWIGDEFLVNAPLLKNQLSSGERMVKVSGEGKPSKTIFRVKEIFSTATLMSAELLTGRTHQIRVHAAYKHHPLAGDDKYGDEFFNSSMRKAGLKRLFLHAYQLTFNVAGNVQCVEAPLDETLLSVLKTLRLEA
ncbi:MAG: 23S rRNA pseudouridine(955/2504/2580) synthase RluC [Gammaproteobacteria bacterium CG11_big_fil_rev_8_21_14_0_20_46_22]|nr:MAG: 23S rRNA pseudouridine(955/2504/2580) synthase RluC [Gammaproteobacteria bacterium CG11_big_fil_rev_8_21_14_0_20_46_22]